MTSPAELLRSGAKKPAGQLPNWFFYTREGKFIAACRDDLPGTPWRGLSPGRRNLLRRTFFEGIRIDPSGPVTSLSPSGYVVTPDGIMALLEYDSSQDSLSNVVRATLHVDWTQSPTMIARRFGHWLTRREIGGTARHRLNEFQIEEVEFDPGWKSSKINVRLPRDCPKKELTKRFSDWIKGHTPKGVKADGSGRDNTLVDKLHWLSAWRVISAAGSADKAINSLGEAFPDQLPYSTASRLLAAKRKASGFLRNGFRSDFLAQDEKKRLSGLVLGEANCNLRVVQDTSRQPLESPLEEQLTRILQQVPPFLRLPAPGTRCPYSNLSRTGLVELIAPVERNGFRPPVVATYLKRNERARRGIWLIPSENLFRHLLSATRKAKESYAQMQRSREVS